MPDHRPTPPAAHPMAFLSDVHGNLAALEAVLEELDRRGVTRIFVAGDLLLGGDAPLEVWQRLEKVGARCTRGLSDSSLVHIDPASLVPGNDEEQRRAERFASTRRAVGDLVIERLRRLPEVLRIPMIDGRELIMVHGSPADPGVDITHDLDDAEILALIADDPADMVVCGGSHVPFQRIVDTVHVINVGSVGAAPEGPIAHFTVVTPRMSGTEVLQDYVSYGPE